MGKIGRAYKEPVYWKTYDYLSGHTYILGDKYASKREAMARAISDGMRVISQSTVPITDDQKRIAELELRLKEVETCGVTK
mgnify:CR=1 FL=1